MDVLEKYFRKYFEFAVCNWKDKIKEIKFLEIYLVYWIMNSNSNKFEVEH